MYDNKSHRHLPDVRFERLNAKNFAVENLTQEQFSRWNSMGSSHRFLAYKGKELVVFTVLDGQPQISNTLICTAAGLSIEGGFHSEWETDTDGIIRIAHTPVEIANNCWLWHSFDCQVRFQPYNGVYGVSLPLVYKQRSNPERINEDHTYVLERHAYQAMFGE